MKLDIAVSGAIGLVVGGIIFLVASRFRENVPLLIEGTLAVGAAYLVVGAAAVAEMPLMIWALRRMSRDPSAPRLAVLGTNSAYTAFAAVYAAAFVVVTGNEPLALLLVALGLVRFATGIWIR